MIINRIVDHFADESGDLEITDIRIGLEYAAVELSDGSLGVSFVFREEVGHCCSRDFGPGGYIGTGASEAVRWALDLKDTLPASIGIAVINALSSPETIPENKEKDAAMEIGFRKTDTVGMVGNFRPMVKDIAGKVSRLCIFERRTGGDPMIYPDWAAYSLLPECDIAIISGTTNINKTLDVLLSCCTGVREVAVIGPSTVMYPEAYKDTPVTLLAGAYADPSLKDEIFSVVSQGGGGFKLLTYLKKYAIRLE